MHVTIATLNGLECRIIFVRLFTTGICALYNVATGQIMWISPFLNSNFHTRNIKIKSNKTIIEEHLLVAGE